MSKNTVAVTAAIAALFVYAVPALALDAWWLPDHNSSVQVTTETTAVSNTGGNSQSNVVSVNKASHVVGLAVGLGGYKEITTGPATADARSITVVSAATPHTGFAPANSNATTKVASATLASADSGANYQDNVVDVSKAHGVIAGAGGLTGTSVIRTGSASSTTRSVTLVNVNRHGFGH
ncbi:MAG: hypothetical protein WCT01_03000 [Candidatus Shapirobacteria bacterium]|jgi:hypothetical protein